jgi:hypothetical protein
MKRLARNSHALTAKKNFTTTNMNKSETIENIAKALMVFHEEVKNITKESENPFYKSKYASLGNILDAIKLPLAKAELTFAQFPTGEYELTTILMHASGEWIESSYKMQPTQPTPQGAGSVITYQRRYALAAILGLNTDDDDDGNVASTGFTKAALEKGNKKEIII